MAQLWLRMAVLSFWILCLILLALVGIKWCASQDFAWAGLMPMQVCLTFSQSENFDHEMLVHLRKVYWGNLELYVAHLCLHHLEQQQMQVCSHIGACVSLLLLDCTVV